ncbi:unnamed protein product [Dracunculus medinensis]|uniref:Rieske domain-containing protein n=1 Tax=Dracunculus medinensis TaxID=318479 RepID=A0A0N4UNS4_DRAME|nr:unnamed protein product [Dracunculus medinensis]
MISFVLDMNKAVILSEIRVAAGGSPVTIPIDSVVKKSDFFGTVSASFDAHEIPARWYISIQSGRKVILRLVNKICLQTTAIARNLPKCTFYARRDVSHSCLEHQNAYGLCKQNTRLF